MLLYTTTLLAQPVIELVLYKSGFDDPVDIAHAGDDRLFIVERQGIIKIIDGSGETLSTPFLNITDKIESGYSEQGLLGLAFAPDYDSSGVFYVNYTDNDDNTVVARYHVSTFDANIADESTEQIVFTANQPYINHNGGDLAFGPDGYLYIGLGDGGDAGDPGNRALDPLEKLGKMHRIDVHGVDTYVTPTTNPYYGSSDTLETIWDFGLRNPWRYNFDRLTGDLWIGDVGQNLWEEINFEPAGTGGFNYGWKCYEASDEFSPGSCDDGVTYTFPIFEYNHSFSSGGYAVVGGYVYRGTAYPGLYGYYICGDNVSNNWWTIYPAAGGGWDVQIHEDVSSNISTFGEDASGELYCAELYTGRIYKITDVCGDFALSATAVDYQCGTTNGSINLTITGGDAPYEIEWSNGAESEDLTELTEAGTYSVIVTDDAGCVKTLEVIINEIPAFEATFTVSGNTLTAVGGVSWQWFLNGEAITGATEQEYVISEPGIYSVEITNENGCTELSAETEVSVGIMIPEYVQQIDMFPNPASENLTYSFYTVENLTDLLITVYDAYGKVMFSETIPSITNGFQRQIAIHTFAEGMYLLKAQCKGFYWNGSFVIKR
jgi:glucose/arabinose dehydrogenase